MTYQELFALTEANSKAIDKLAARTEANSKAIDKLAARTEANSKAIDKLAARTEANSKAIDKLTARTEANSKAIDNLTASIAELRANSRAEQARRDADNARRDAENARRDKELAEAQARWEKDNARRDAENARRDKELAEAQARWEKDNARRDAENARRDKELAEAQARWEKENARRDKEFAAAQVRWEKFDKKHEKFMKRYGGYVDNESRKVEDFFIEGIRQQGLKLGAIKFVDIIPNARRLKQKVVAIELDALLINGTTVGILEVKSTLHVNDVAKVREHLIPRFRRHYPEYQDKQLVVVVAGELINPDAAGLAHELGYILLKPNNQGISIDHSCYRAA